MKVVKVTWIDAFDYGKPWVREEDIPDPVPEEAWVTSIGYLIKETDEGIWLTMGTGPDSQFMCPFFIPRVFCKVVEVTDV